MGRGLAGIKKIITIIFYIKTVYFEKLKANEIKLGEG